MYTPLGSSGKSHFQIACDYAANMIDEGEAFVDAVAEAASYYGYTFADIQEEMTARSAAKRQRFAAPKPLPKHVETPLPAGAWALVGAAGLTLTLRPFPQEMSDGRTDYRFTAEPMANVTLEIRSLLAQHRDAFVRDLETRRCDDLFPPVDPAPSLAMVQALSSGRELGPSEL